jgi:hypothetical protein
MKVSQYIPNSGPFRLLQAAVAGSIIIAAVLVAAGTSAKSSTVLPAPEELPANTVAVVSHVPASLGRITKGEFQRALIQGAAQVGRKRPPKPGGNGYEELKTFAMEDRLDTVWIQGLAAEMGITVTPRQVSREVARTKKENFKNEAEYRRFLKQSHYTPRDINERIKLSMLGTRIQENFPGASPAFWRAFLREYRKTWRARTVCAPEYVIGRCSNGGGSPSARTPL